MKRNSICSLIASVVLSAALSAALQRCDYPGAPSSANDTKGTTYPTPTQTGPYAGYWAPDFSARNVRGEAVSIGQLRGKIVVLVFYGTT